MLSAASRLSPCWSDHHSHPLLSRFHKLEKWRKPFYDVLQVYENASVLLPAFYNTRNTDVSIRVKYVLDDFESQQAVYYFHPQYLINVSRYWLGQGVRAKRISTGLILVTAALELCEEVHLFGFWAFPMNPSGIFITHHYYDNVKPRPGFHAMPSEIFNFLHMHSKGILRVHTGTCSCCWCGLLPQMQKCNRNSMPAYCVGGFITPWDYAIIVWYKFPQDIASHRI